MKKSWKIMKTVIGNKRKTIKKKAMFNIHNKTIDSELQISNALFYNVMLTAW